MRHRIRGRNKCPRSPAGFLPGPSITSGLAGGAVWDDPDFDYSDLTQAMEITFRADVIIRDGAEGLILESGAQGTGFCAGIGSDGVLYSFAGNGGSITANNVLMTSWAIPAPSRYLIEFTSSVDPLEGGRLYINGNQVSQSDDYTFSAGQLSGGNVGGIEKVHGSNVRDMPAGCNNNLSNVDILECVVWQDYIP